jgi:hypothetical protein
MKNGTNLWITCIILTLALSLYFSISAFATPWTPLEWQDNGKLTDWVRDRNGNFVDDLIEKEIGAVSIIVDLNQCIGNPATSQFIQYLNSLGDVSYVGKYLSFIVVHGVDAKQAVSIAQRPEVAMVELNVPLKWLDTERRAMKVEASGTYANNLTTEGWHGSLNGNGVNIAILDSGVDNTHSELTGTFRFGYNAITKKVEDPAGNATGHGTWMARFALGTGNLGIAPGAGLVDIKIGDDQTGGTTAALAEALEKVIEKQKAWNIKVVNLSVTFNLNPPYDKNDGKEALSWLVNRVVASGIVVVTAAGNGPNQGDKEIKPPGTASWAITIGAADPGTTVNRNDDVINISTHGPRTDDGDQDKMDELKPEVANSSDSGTSPATARASGLAALLFQRAPDINPGSLKDLLIRTAEDLDSTADTNIKYPDNTPTWDKKWGFGLIDAFEAVDKLKNPNASDLTFIGYDGSTHPSSPWYYSRSLKIKRQGKEVEDIIAQKPHIIYARVLNNSSQSVSNVRVNFAFYQFTAGIPRFYDIGSDFISMINANGIFETSINWTPPTLKAGYDHGCILVTIDYGYDSKFSNMSNFAQKNVKVKATSSPATFTFHVENPLPVDARIDLKVTTDHKDWSVKLSESSFMLTNHDCARTIKATVEPLAGVKPGTEALFFVTAYATERGQEQAVDIGGVALKARFEGKKAESWVWWLIVIFILIALLIAFYAFRKK